MNTETTHPLAAFAKDYAVACGIYEIRYNGDPVYGGQALSVGARMSTHFYELREGIHRHSPKLQELWNQTGGEGFTAHFVDPCTPAELNAREQKYFKKHAKYFRDDGELLNEKIAKSTRDPSIRPRKSIGSGLSMKQQNRLLRLMDKAQAVVESFDPATEKVSPVAMEQMSGVLESCGEGR